MSKKEDDFPTEEDEVAPSNTDCVIEHTERSQPGALANVRGFLALTSLPCGFQPLFRKNRPTFLQAMKQCS
jgi:hypothetical protein